MIGYIIITAIGGLALFAQSVIYHNERKDLYNRLMSRDIGEYLMIDQPKTKLKLRQNYFKKSMSHAYRAMYGNNKDE